MSSVGLLEFPPLLALVLGLTAITYLFAPSHVSSIVIYPKSPTKVILKTADDKERKSVSIEEAVKARCKSLYKKYSAPWWLFK